MRVVCLIICLLILGAQKSSAQYESMYTMYMFDKLLINPAFAGSANYIVASAKNRNQFIGLPDHPSTKTFNFHMPLQKQNLGLGFKIINDKVGALTSSNIAIDLSYHLNLAGGKLSAGFEVGSVRQTITYENLILNNKNDAAFSSHANAGPQLDLNWGLYYQKKQFYLGYSTYHALLANSETTSTTNFILIGNTFSLKKKLDIESSALLVHTLNNPLRIDVNTILMYNSRIGLGTCYRNSGSISLYVRLAILENLRLSYAYDLQAIKSVISTGASHEIVLSYGVKLAPPPAKKEIHPRYYY